MQCHYKKGTMDVKKLIYAAEKAYGYNASMPGIMKIYKIDGTPFCRLSELRTCWQRCTCPAITGVDPDTGKKWLVAADCGPTNVEPWFVQNLTDAPSDPYYFVTVYAGETLVLHRQWSGVIDPSVPMERIASCEQERLAIINEKKEETRKKDLLLNPIKKQTEVYWKNANGKWIELVDDNHFDLIQKLQVKEQSRESWWSWINTKLGW